MSSSEAELAGSGATGPEGTRGRLRRALASLRPAWSTPAALRAVRATIVVPGMFALAYEVIGDLQMATFAAFGGFATLVLAAFGGRRRDKALAHLGLALAGSVLIVIGTAVNASVAVATIVTLPVVFAVLFAGIAGPNVAAGGTAALLAYVLPAASPGTLAMVPSRLAGWWLASVVGTGAVLLLSPRPPGDRLRAAVAASASALAAQLDAGLRGEGTAGSREASIAAKHRLMSAFAETPYRPTGLTVADQALASLVELLEWATTVICESLSEYEDLRPVPAVERDLFAATRDALGGVAALLEGGQAQPDAARLQAALDASMLALRRMPAGDGQFADAVHLSFHARTVGLAARTAVADALIAARRADPDTIAESARRWYGMPADAAGPQRQLGLLAAASGAAWRHASLRSAWFVNSVRGAAALAAAVLVADLGGVQHGFWVVLGTLSVLRTSASATGATALRALAGTVAGFVIGAALMLAIGTGPIGLWVALPMAVLFAAYAPGTLPFAVGQAAFTVVVSVLYNLLVPIGWQIGVVRIEDVAIGCAVSVAVGVLFWPRGASAVVADSLADTFRETGRYFAQSVNWALGLRTATPDPSRAVTTELRLDDGLRGLLTEQGTKHLATQDLWRLLGGTVRLRLTAQSLAGLPSPDAEPDLASETLSGQAARLAGWFDDVADQLARPSRLPPDQARAGTPAAPALAVPALSAVAASATAQTLPCTLWVEQHLQHLQPSLQALIGPVTEIARLRRTPWWR
ncbi:MAG: FUSC family protein [Gemmatimonadota bacterium]